MKDKRKGLVLQLINFITVLLMLLPFAYCWLSYYAERMMLPFFARGNWYMLIVYVAVYIAFGRVYDGFSLTTNRISATVFSQAIALFATDAAMYLILILVTRRYLLTPLPMVQTYLVQIILVGFTTTLCHKWYFAAFPPFAAAVVYDTREGMESLIREYGLNKEFRVCETLKVDQCLEDLSVLDDVDVVFLSGVHSHDRNTLMKYCVQRGQTCYVIPRIGDVMMSGARRSHMFHLEILEIAPYNPPLYYLFVKRLFDVLLSAAGLIVLSPLLLVTGLLIKLQDGGPVFYRQERLTKDGRHFMLIKFRSMSVDAEKDGIARLSTGSNDARVTKVGRVIRKFRIDELPQLLNILAGQLSICGPRPERPEIAAQYEKTLPEFALRLQAKAGLTGYAQVYGKYNTTPYDKLLMDLMYIAHPSVLEDLRIMFATLKVVFIPESTEGVSQGQTTALDPDRKSED